MSAVAQEAQAAEARTKEAGPGPLEPLPRGADGLPIILAQRPGQARASQMHGRRR